MKKQDLYNASGYVDSTAFLAMRNIEREKIMRTNQTYRRGEVYLADLKAPFGSVQGGTRPVLILQNNIGNLYCPTLVVAPLTAQCSKKAKQPTHCRLCDVRGLPNDSQALLEQITTIDKRCIKKYMGRLTLQQMTEVDVAIEISLGISPAAEMDAP